MTDYISRQAAIDAIGEKADEIYKTKQKGATYPHNDFFQGMAYAEDVVKQLPSAQPERKMGKWTNVGTIENKWLVSKCSACRYQTVDAGNYCPNCGAYMRGEPDE